MTSHASDIPREVDGPRTLRPAELAAAHELSALCFGHSTLQDLPAGGYRPTRRQSVEVISHNGTPVCQMGVYYSSLRVCGSRFRVASIGGVCTHPDYRGLGLATRLLDYCLRSMTSRGTRVVLVSGTRGLYRRAGCTTAQIMEPVVLQPGQLAHDTTGVTVRPAGPADAVLCARLYQMEPVHFVRRVEDFRNSLESTDGGPTGDNWIVEVEGRPAGYVFLRVPWSHKPEDRVREVMLQGECPGSRTALVPALSDLMVRLRLEELWLAVPWQDADFRHLLRRQGILEDTTTLFGHTMRILNFPGLMSDLRGLVDSRLTSSQRRGLEFAQDRDSYTIVRESERVVLDGVGMTRLVLGAPADPNDASPATDSAIGEIATSLFPLPSVVPGLNCR